MKTFKHKIDKAELVAEALEFFYKHYVLGRLTWSERRLKQEIELHMTEEQLMEFIAKSKGEIV